MSEDRNDVAVGRAKLNGAKAKADLAEAKLKQKWEKSLRRPIRFGGLPVAARRLGSLLRLRADDLVYQCVRPPPMT